jgi:hypothetical protein
LVIGDSGEAERQIRDDSEQHRSAATLASPIVQEVFAFVKRNLSEA